MLLKAYLPGLLTSLTGGLFVILGVFTFGKPLLFDRLFILVLLFSLFVCRKNINVVGVILILLAIRLIDEGAWAFLDSSWLAICKVTFYGFAIAICYWAWYDKLAKLLFAMLLICISAEIYWLITATQSVAIHWFVFMLAANILVRDLVFSRVQYTEQLGFNNALSTHLDWKIYSIKAVSIFLIVAMICEYLLRNMFGFSQALLVYQLYPYAMQAISTFIVWSIFHESAKLLAPNLLRA